MRSAIRPRQRQAIEEMPDPREGKPWFQSLPSAYRARMTEEWRAELVRSIEVRNRALACAGKDVLRAAVIFAVGDWMCSYGSVATFAGALLFGAVVGIVTALPGVKRLLCIVIGMLSFMLWLQLSRGGVNLVSMFTVVVIGGAFAYHGWRKEDAGGMD